ncbi:hypothetical protein AAMO2058_001712600 [Amorphochlora amoebiformis]
MLLSPDSRPTRISRTSPATKAPKSTFGLVLLIFFAILTVSTEVSTTVGEGVGRVYEIDQSYTLNGAVPTHCNPIKSEGSVDKHRAVMDLLDKLERNLTLIHQGSLYRQTPVALLDKMRERYEKKVNSSISLVKYERDLRIDADRDRQRLHALLENAEKKIREAEIRTKDATQRLKVVETEVTLATLRYQQAEQAVEKQEEPPSKAPGQEEYLRSLEVDVRRLVQNEAEMNKELAKLKKVLENSRRMREQEKMAKEMIQVEVRDLRNTVASLTSQLNSGLKEPFSRNSDPVSRNSDPVSRDSDSVSRNSNPVVSPRGQGESIDISEAKRYPTPAPVETTQGFQIDRVVGELADVRFQNEKLKDRIERVTETAQLNQQRTMKLNREKLLLERNMALLQEENKKNSAKIEELLKDLAYFEYEAYKFEKIANGTNPEDVPVYPAGFPPGFRPPRHWGASMFSRFPGGRAPANTMNATVALNTSDIMLST